MKCGVINLNYQFSCAGLLAEQNEINAIRSLTTTGYTSLSLSLALLTFFNNNKMLFPNL